MTTRRSPLLQAWWLLAVAPALFAAEPDPCQTQANTLEMNACAKQQLDASDRELNRAYRATLAQLGERSATGQDAAGPRARLVQAQRQWLAFRDADCQAQGALYEGGSVKTVIVLGCLREHNELRTKQLDPRRWQGG